MTHKEFIMDVVREDRPKTKATIKGYRLTIEAVGLRQSDAVAHALSLIGTMIQNVSDEDQHYDGVNGSATGKLEAVTKKKGEK